jgi:hypothetical protein
MSRTTTSGMKWQLLVGAILVLVAGTPLVIAPAQTETNFAWTIKPPLLTAVFLGSSYWASFLLGFIASRRRLWAEARIAAPASYLFTVLTLIATLLHIDKFHLNGSDIHAVVFTWFWIAVYAGVPVTMTYVLYRQCRVRAEDLPRRQPLPAWMRISFSVLGVVLLTAGVALFLLPQAAGPYWPWTLTPLTARAIAAWLMAIGAGSVHVAYENDGMRVRPALIFFAVFCVLQVSALVRYPADFAWTEPRGWFYLAVLAALFALGSTGWARYARAPVAERTRPR